jgi:hypothetical protein
MSVTPDANKRSQLIAVSFSEISCVVVLKNAPCPSRLVARQRWTFLENRA